MIYYNYKNKNNIVIKKYSYNTFSFIVFTILMIGTFSFFTFADDVNLSLIEDFDRDGLSNAEEKSLGTDPKKSDTDGDGYSDGVEIESGYNPLISAPGDRIMNPRKITTISPITTHTTNVTQQISEDVISHLADIQESGTTEITSEEFSNIISKSIDEEVDFVKAPQVELSEINVKIQDYDDLSENERYEQMREDVIEYSTALSYIFASNFPEGFFTNPTQDISSKLLLEFNNFAQTLTEYSFFTDMADSALAAKSQMYEVDVPEEMVPIHMRGLYLLNYTESLRSSESYKNASTDITPMISTLAQIQGLTTLLTEVQDMITEKLDKYEIDEAFI